MHKLESAHCFSQNRYNALKNKRGEVLKSVENAIRLFLVLL